MPSDFHLSAELPADPDERLRVRADAIKLALEHASTDPGFRLKMIVGEAYARYSEVVTWLVAEIEKEGDDVHKALIARGLSRPSVQEVHALLMGDALATSILTECQTASIPAIPGRD